MTKKTITVNGESTEWWQGMTIKDILVLKNYTFKLLVTNVNGELVKRKDYDSFTVPENADVKIIHLISGG
ncbi:MAG: sulfur carrier protein ThiS [Candidatus Delongbacteria bacterium]